MAITITVTGLGRPLTVNRTRQMHRQELGREVRGWRQAGRGGMSTVLRKCRDDPAVIGLLEHIVGGGSVVVEAWPVHDSARSPQDVGACYPAVKACIDGFVDANLIPDDSSEYLFAIVMHRPVIGRENGLRLRVKPDIEQQEETE